VTNRGKLCEESRLRRVIFTLSALVLLLSLSPAHAKNALAAPPGVSIRVTYGGPVFAAKGMTLYRADFDEVGKPSKCASEELTRFIRETQRIDWPLPYAPGERIPCIKKWPPFVAAPNARPIGDWTIVKRPDGIQQWSYKGRPTYTSVRDHRPGDVNGLNQNFSGRNPSPWGPLEAPFLAPQHIQLKKLERSLSLVDADGSLLLTNVGPTGKRLSCSGECGKGLAPVGVTPAAIPYGDWTIVSPRKGGVKQWAYRGQPLFRVTEGQDASKVEGFRNVDAYVMPSFPAIFDVRMGPVGPIATTRDGMTLYYFLCKEGTFQGLSCDAPGDTPIFYQSSCGGTAAECLNTFKFVKAAPGSETEENEYWTVKRIDLANPTRALGKGETGTPVWHYRDHPVLTYSEDKAPGDYWGAGDLAFDWSSLELCHAHVDVKPGL
jgi:predicted lipoprotein with Yx(FWY)xxD motif